MVKCAKVPKTNKGGFRNFPKPRVDVEHLTDTLNAYIKDQGCASAFQFHEYEGVWTSCAIRPKPLAKLAPYLLCLLKAEPQGAMIYTELKAALTNALLKHSEAKPKGGSVNEVAGDIADRTMVILHHARRLAVGKNAEQEWDKVKESLPINSPLFQNLKKVKEIIEDNANFNRPRLSPGSSSHSLAASSHATQAASGSSSLSNHPMVSGNPDLDLSQTSEGLPALNFLSKISKGPESTLPDGSDMDDDEKLASTVAAPKVFKKPAAATVSTILKKPGSPKAPAGLATSSDVVDLETVSLKGPFKAQSYIVHKKPAKLIVACNKKQSEKFHQVLVKVLKKIESTPGATKAQAIEWRNTYLC
jgi:hypothetical protein